MRTRALLVVALLALSACSDDSRDPADHETILESAGGPGTIATSDDPVPLPIGKDDLPLDRTYFTPEGFRPEMVISVPDLGLQGWTSVHRSADAFDAGQAAAGVDAPLVVVAFLVPTEGSAEQALAAVRQAASDAGAEVRDSEGAFGVVARTGIEIIGGNGQVVASRDGEIALDAVPEGRLQVWAADSGPDPMLVVVFAPDAGTWGKAVAASQRLAGAILYM